MNRYRVLFLSLTALLLSFSAPAQVAPPYCGPGYGNGVMGFLTPEQRLMHFAEVQKATADMSFNDMRTYRWDFRSKVMAMSAVERKKFADDLTAKWNALPADQRSKLQQDFSAYRGSGQWARGVGRGMGRGRGGCWW
jgi:hypothetical protein